MDALNPSSGNKRGFSSASSVKKHDASDSLDPELSFRITFRKIVSSLSIICIFGLVIDQVISGNVFPFYHNSLWFCRFQPSFCGLIEPTFFGEFTHKGLLVDAVGTLLVPTQPTSQVQHDQTHLRSPSRQARQSTNDKSRPN